MKYFVYGIVIDSLYVTTRLLWCIAALMLPLSITLTMLKVNGIILIEWEKIISCVLFLVILDPILLIIDFFRFSFEYEIGGGENVERRTKENGWE